MAKKTKPSFPSYSGSNSMLANAYRGYYNAEAMAGLYNNPITQMQQMLVGMGQQWMKQKEKDKQEAKLYAAKTLKIMDKIPGVSHLNPEAYGVLTNRVNEIVQQYDDFAAEGDMQSAGQAMQQVNHIVKQMQELEGTFELHANGLLDETISKGANDVPLNSIFKENGDYKFNLDENSNISFVAPGKVGGMPTAYTMDDLNSGSITVNDTFMPDYEKTMLDKLKEQKATKDYNFDDGFWNKKINSYLRKSNDLISVVHDDVFGLTDKEGNPISIYEKWVQENPNKSANWMDPSSKNIPAVTDGNYWTGGYNEDQMRAYATQVLKQHAKDDWDVKKGSIIPESKNPKNTPINFETGLPFDTGEKAQIDKNTYVSPGPLQEAYIGMRDGKEFSYGGMIFTPNDDGRFTTDDEKEPLTIRDIIDSMDEKKGFIKADPYFKNLYNTRDWTPTSKNQANIKEQNQKGLASWNMLNKDDDNDAADALNKFFKLSDDGNVKFVPYARWHQRGVGIKDAWATNDIMMINPVSGKPIKDTKGNVYRFSTDGSQEDLQKVIDEINKNPFIKPYIKPRGGFDPNSY